MSFEVKAIGGDIHPSLFFQFYIYTPSPCVRLRSKHFAGGMVCFQSLVLSTSALTIADTRNLVAALGYRIDKCTIGRPNQ